jgi:hypothetical protein
MKHLIIVIVYTQQDENLKKKLMGLLYASETVTQRLWLRGYICNKCGTVPHSIVIGTTQVPYNDERTRKHGQAGDQLSAVREVLKNCREL